MPREGYGQMVELVSSGLVALCLVALALAARLFSRSAAALDADGRRRRTGLILLTAAAIVSGFLLGIPLATLIERREADRPLAALPLLAVEAALWLRSVTWADSALMRYFRGDSAAWNPRSRWPFLLAWTIPAAALPALLLLRTR